MKIIRLAGVAIIGITMLLFAANSFVRVISGPDKPSQGIVMHWFAGNASKGGVSRHFDETFAHYGEAIVLMNAAVERNEDFFTSDLTQIASSMRRALAEADLVSNQLLDKIHPDMRRRFREGYQDGLKKIVKGLETRNQQALQDGGNLCDAFKLWVEAERKNMSTPSSGD